MRKFANTQQNRIKSGITVVSSKTGDPIGYTVPPNFYRYDSSATRLAQAAIVRRRK